MKDANMHPLKRTRLNLPRPLTQAQLAGLAGVSKSTVERAERGEAIRVDSIQLLCDFLEKDARELGLASTDTEDKKEEYHSKGFEKAQTQSSQSTIWTPEKRLVTIPNSLTEQRSIDMKHSQDGNISRRQFLPLVASVPFLGLAQVSQLLHAEEVLSVFTTYIPISWRLYFDGHLSEAESILSDCLSQLSSLAAQPSIYQGVAASLASKAEQLACMLALQPQNFRDALMHATQAFHYASLAKDPNLQAASLIRKALVYFYLKRSEQRLEAYQEATQYANNVSPLLRGRVYMGLAEAHSSLVHEMKLVDTSKNAVEEQEHKALEYLDLMYASFPDYPQDDPTFIYTHFKLPEGYEALVYLNIGQAQRAWGAFVKADKNTPATVVPDRVELSLRQSRALFAMGDLKQGTQYLESSITSAIALKSNLRYNEAFDIYQEVRTNWPNERRINGIGDWFIQ